MGGRQYISILEKKPFLQREAASEKDKGIKKKGEHGHKLPRMDV